MQLGAGESPTGARLGAPRGAVAQPDHRLLAGTHIEALQHLLGVVPHGVRREGEHPGDIGGGMALCQEERHLSLPGAQAEPLLDVVRGEPPRRAALDHEDKPFRLGHAVQCHRLETDPLSSRD